MQEFLEMPLVDLMHEIRAMNQVKRLMEKHCHCKHRHDEGRLINAGLAWKQRVGRAFRDEK